jgi:hypothetical protein
MGGPVGFGKVGGGDACGEPRDNRGSAPLEAPGRALVSLLAPRLTEVAWEPVETLPGARP